MTADTTVGRRSSGASRPGMYAVCPVGSTLEREGSFVTCRCPRP